MERDPELEVYGEHPPETAEIRRSLRRQMFDSLRKHRDQSNAEHDVGVMVRDETGTHYKTALSETEFKRDPETHQIIMSFLHEINNLDGSQKIRKIAIPLS